MLWAEGEPTMLYGPDGVGKTTVTQQLILCRIGIADPRLLDQPVLVSDHKVLYLALDRPRQAARSMRRMVSEADCDVLAGRLVVWQGFPPFDAVRDSESLARFALERDARTVFVDSVKDLAPNLSDEEAASALHRAWQLCVDEGIEVFALHHPRNAQVGNKRPKALADVYGNRWLYAGCGSAILLWGDAGDPVVELEHLKQPSDVVGPLKLLHDNVTGRTTVMDASDVVALVAANGGCATAADIANHCSPGPSPTRSRRRGASSTQGYAGGGSSGWSRRARGVVRRFAIDCPGKSQ